MAAYLVVTGLLFLIVGVRALLRPIESVAVPYSLDANSIDAKNYLRSGAGGVTIACAGVMLVGAFVASLAFAAVLLAVTVLGGLIFGRTVSWAIDGSPGVVPWVSGVFEMVGFLSGLYWLTSA